jgi:hypothetical protein
MIVNPLEYTTMPKKKAAVTLEHPPRGVEAVSTREAAMVLGCSMGHIRKLISKGLLGDRGTTWWRVSPRALMIRLKTIEEYDKRTSNSKFGVARGGFTIDR